MGPDLIAGAGSQASCNQSESHIVDRLESLDDVMFPAISGDPQAAEAAAPAWKEAVSELGADILAETRCEYLRYARATWQFLSQQTVQQPFRVLAVMKIIAILMGEDV